MTFSLTCLRKAAQQEPPGWLEHIISRGRLIGGILHINPFVWAQISARSGRWGDVIAIGAKPVARAIDATAAKVGLKTDVQNCRGCAKRGTRLNGGREMV